MQLKHNLHLAYCTNIHRGEDWPQTFHSLQQHTLAVRKRVCPNQPYAIGLRLSDLASRQLSDPPTLSSFRHWLDQNHCYVFTINGFPYGQFHGARVKEQVYLPDWTSNDRVDFTNRLFRLLAELLPDGIEGSVSTVPGSFKEFITTPEQTAQMRANLWRCVEQIAQLSASTGKTLHLGLEPEPLCYIETSDETVRFLDQIRSEHPNDPRFQRHLGVNYDTCHLAVEFEEARDVIERFRSHQINISKIHLSSALKVVSTPEVRRALRQFADDIYFHQVIERAPGGTLKRYRDLDVALQENQAAPSSDAREWRIHFHVPLHSPPTPLFNNTADHLLELMALLGQDPTLCRHLEMETYTWEVMPPEMKQGDVVDQLAHEYEWCLQHLSPLGLGTQ